MAKLTAMPNQDEIVHAVALSAGVFVLTHVWMVELAQQANSWTLEAMAPFFVFMTIGVLVWDRLFHHLFK